jgi:hypothetical protein
VVDGAVLTASLNRTLAQTSFEACLKTKLDDAFAKENGKFQVLMDLSTIPAPTGLGFRKGPDGFLHASFGGLFSSRPQSRRRLCDEMKVASRPQPPRPGGPGRPSETARAEIPRPPVPTAPPPTPQPMPPQPTPPSGPMGQPVQPLMPQAMPPAPQPPPQAMPPPGASEPAPE